VEPRILVQPDTPGDNVRLPVIQEPDRQLRTQVQNVTFQADYPGVIACWLESKTEDGRFYG
jgi:hypothetical protein